MIEEQANSSRYIGLLQNPIVINMALLTICDTFFYIANLYYFMTKQITGEIRCKISILTFFCILNIINVAFILDLQNPGDFYFRNQKQPQK